MPIMRRACTGRRRPHEPNFSFKASPLVQQRVRLLLKILSTHSYMHHREFRPTPTPPNSRKFAVSCQVSKENLGKGPKNPECSKSALFLRKHQENQFGKILGGGRWGSECGIYWEISVCSQHSRTPLASILFHHSSTSSLLVEAFIARTSTHTTIPPPRVYMVRIF